MNMATRTIGLILWAALMIPSVGCNDALRTQMVLFDFESDADLDQIHWKCHTLFTLSDQYATHGTKSLKMELYPSTYPGFASPLKQNDLKNFTAFCFDIYNPEGKEVPITLRIDDKEDSPDYSDRYNRTFTLTPGMNRMTIPLGSLITSGTDRKLDLEKINRFLLFSVNPEQKLILYLDHIRLVSGKQMGEGRPLRPDAGVYD